MVGSLRKFLCLLLWSLRTMPVPCPGTSIAHTGPLRPCLGEFLLQSIPLSTASISSTTEKLWTTQALLFLRNREASSCLESPSATYHALPVFDKIYLAHRCFYAPFFSFPLSNKTQHECDCYGKGNILTFFSEGGRVLLLPIVIWFSQTLQCGSTCHGLIYVELVWR